MGSEFFRVDGVELKRMSPPTVQEMIRKSSLVVTEIIGPACGSFEQELLALAPLSSVIDLQGENFIVNACAY